MIEEFNNEIAKIESLQELQNLRVKYLGKKGLLTQQLKALGKLAPEERKQAGQSINRDKKQMLAIIDDAKTRLEQKAINDKLVAERVDVSLPAYKLSTGGLHLITKTINKLEDVFRSMGYDVVMGPELEDEFHNFDALNTPNGTQPETCKIPFGPQMAEFYELILAQCKFATWKPISHHLRS